MKQLNLTTMCIVCAALIGFFSSCGKNEEGPNVPPVSGGQTETPEGELPWDGEYPSIDVAKLLLQEALVHEVEGPNHRNYVVLISSAKHLAAMNVLVTNNETIKDPEGVELTCARLRYRLTTDIDLNHKPWTSIGGMEYGSGTNFQGDFDGQGYTIKKLNVYYNDGNKDVTAQYAGLFRNVIPSVDDPSWGISHLIVEGAINVTALKECYAGGISALNNGGNIKFCRFNGDINVSLLYLSNNYFCVGGIAGRNYEGKIASCISDASINCKASYRNPTIRKGGLVGMSEGSYSYHSILSYSAWNNVSEKNAIGHISPSAYTESTANNGFTDIAALNELLPDMNIVVTPENTYAWQANSNAQGYPLLVKQ